MISVTFSTLELCPFVHIRLNVPRKFILKVYHKKTYLTKEEVEKISRKKAQVEKIINEASHILSLVDKALLKSPNTLPIDTP